MDIIKYKKAGKNKYKISLSNNEQITLYEDIILKYELLLKKKIDNLEEILEENKNYEAYDKALDYINIRIRCEKEIRDFLKKKDFSSSLINETIKKLRDKGLIDDVSYVKAYTYDKFNINNYGPNKIVSELLKLNIDKEIVYENVIINEEDIKEKLNKLIDKKIKSLKKYTGDVLKYKIETYFVNMGYDKNTVDKILLDKNIYNNDSYEEEYNKLYKKYSSKYSGYELEMKIKQKLYQKGFKK